MNKKLVALLLSGMLVLPMTGCNASVKLFGNEIFSVDDSGDAGIKDPIEDTLVEDTGDLTEAEVIAFITDGEYTLSINSTGEQFKFSNGDILEGLYPDTQYEVVYLGDNAYEVKVFDPDTDNAALFRFRYPDEALEIVAVAHDGQVYEGQEASDAFAMLVYQLKLQGDDSGKKSQMETHQL